jgi:glycosyltransferase involved in cell wall biosynthesis
MSDQPAPRRRSQSRGVLVFGMYDLAGMDRAPKVRIALMTEALARQTRTERISGGRAGRFVASARWLAAGGPRRVGAVYVESATTSAMPADLAFLAMMRMLGRPVGVYFRDAYQLYRDVHPRTRRRQVLSDWLWRLSTPLLKRLATVRYAPSSGLAAALGLSGAVMLPPGTDQTLPDLGIGEPDVVATIAQIAPGSGLDVLVEAMAIVRQRRPAASLTVVARSVDAETARGLPDWVQVIPANRDSLAELLRPARVCVLPLPINAYTNLAVAVRLLDFLGFGKPIVATDTTETRAILASSQAGTVTEFNPAGLAEGILPILDDEDLARRLAANARRYACSPGATWDARARTVLETLGLVAAADAADETSSADPGANHG